jgi:CheY-like chemotaxis protein
MFQRKNLGAQIERRKVLFIGNDSAASHAVCGFLRTMGCRCTATPSREALTRIEHELFDVVLLDVTHSQFPHEQTILAIQEVRPALAERILLITGSKSAEGNILGNLPHISLEKPLSQIWTKLEEILAVSQPSSFAPPGMQNARLIFDSFSSPVAAGVRSSLRSARQLAYQHSSTTINLLIHLKKKEVRISLAGQVLDVSMREVHGLPVLLSSQSGILAETTTSQFGEFGLETDLLEYAGLQIRLSEGSWIYVPLENMDWKRKPM